jgi:hypothetical protein
MRGILDKIDPLDVDDFLIKVEESFQIKIIDDDFKVNTFGEFVDYVESKLKQKYFVNDKNCTSQFLFYKIRNRLINSNYSKENIVPETKLNKLIGIKSRKKKILEIQNELGFKVDALRAPNIIWIAILLLFIFLVINLFLQMISTVSLLIAVGIFLMLIFISNQLALIFKDKTVGQLVKRIERENYLLSQKEQTIYNPNEIEANLKEFFIDYFDFHKQKITRDTIL